MTSVNAFFPPTPQFLRTGKNTPRSSPPCHTRRAGSYLSQPPALCTRPVIRARYVSFPFWYSAPDPALNRRQNTRPRPWSLCSSHRGPLPEKGCQRRHRHAGEQPTSGLGDESCVQAEVHSNAIGRSEVETSI